MYKAARFRYKFSADGLKQYWSIPLDPATSEITSFWTHRGLFKFKRLVMGTKNAATVAQNANNPRPEHDPEPQVQEQHRELRR